MCSIGTIIPKKHSSDVQFAQVDENSHAWMAGHTCGYSATASCDAFLIKFDAQGAHQWTRMHGGEDSDYAMALQAVGCEVVLF